MDSVRERIEEDERRFLSSRAALASESGGRAVSEPPHPLRTDYQRDRDRILHSKAFRRLAHKTQVFLAPELDHYRVRLTHTLEVAQVARTIARVLRLNEDLTEAICLGHDLGHTPFGHLGEEVLSEFLGHGFRHNHQSLRIVDHLEVRPKARGLNLTQEVRDGIVNHTWSEPEPSTLEGQVARYSDRIAYINHDIDDALRAGVLAPEDLPAETSSILGESSSQRIDTMVASLVDASANSDQVQMTPEVFDVLLSTREFLFEKVYNRPEVRPESDLARERLEMVLRHYQEHPGDLPESSDEDDFETKLVDYVAGMTDRFAINEFERIAGTSFEGAR